MKTRIYATPAVKGLEYVFCPAMLDITKKRIAEGGRGDPTEK